jgi:FkbM family methyltransferase
LTQKHFIASQLLPFISDRGMAIDVGSNVGTYSLFLGRYFDRVLAFDPSEQACRLLNLTLELSGINNVSVSQVALGAETGARVLEFPSQIIPNRGMARIVAGDSAIQGGRASVVNVVRGDEALARERPVGFVKIDVEGAESDVVAGLAETLERDRPALAIEVLSLEATVHVTASLPKGYGGYGLVKVRRGRKLRPLAEVADVAGLDLAYFLPRTTGDRLLNTLIPELG